MIAVRRDALDGVRAMVWFLLPVMAGLEIDGARRPRFARGQTNTLKRAIGVSHVYRAVEPTVGHALYTRDIARGLQDPVGHVRALKLDPWSSSGFFRSCKDVGVDVTGGGDKEARFIDSQMWLEFRGPLRCQWSRGKLGNRPITVSHGVVSAIH